jgi:hypothetical protein
LQQKIHLQPRWETFSCHPWQPQLTITRTISSQKSAKTTKIRVFDAPVAPGPPFQAAQKSHQKIIKREDERFKARAKRKDERFKERAKQEDKAFKERAKQEGERTKREDGRFEGRMKRNDELHKMKGQDARMKLDDDRMKQENELHNERMKRHDERMKRHDKRFEEMAK